MGVLETLLRPAISLMNRQIEASTPARALCEELDGRVFAVHVKDSALAAYFVICPTGIFLHTSIDGDADAIISGSLVSLARLAATNDEALIREGLIELTGDAVLVSAFRKLLVHGRPDLEEELSSLVGDVAAHGVGEFVRGARKWGRETRQTISQNVVEYFQEESRALPSRYEADAFRKQVQTLRDDVARFEAQLAQFETSTAGKSA
jgi:ubiquinone biosynthesis protein UbiJ